MVDRHVKGPQAQECLLIIVYPFDKHNFDKGATLEIAKGVQWWPPCTPVRVKLINCDHKPARMPKCMWAL